MCYVELRVTVSCIKMSVAQHCLNGKTYVAGNNEPYVGLHVQRPLSLTVFKPKLRFPRDVRKILKYEIS